MFICALTSLVCFWPSAANATAKTNKKFVGDKCTNYRGTNPNLKPGARYRLVGNYVIDTQHHHWAELHGFSTVQKIG